MGCVWGGVEVVKSNGEEVTSVKNRRAYKRKVDKEKKIIEEKTLESNGKGEGEGRASS